MKSRLSAVVRVSDAVAGELETRILEGSLRPGDRLPGERELSVELGVSRPSLREAIQKLVSKGLLTTRHGGGTFVTDRMEAPFVDPWQDMLAGHPNLQSDLIEFRLMLESHAAALAAERATDADIERLDAAYRALGDAYASEDMATAVAADVAFHQVIAEATHNVMIGHLTASLLRLIHGHVSSNLVHLHERAEHWELLKHQHREIWQAVRDHRADAAASAAREHIEFVRRTMVARAAEEERRHSAMRRLGNPVS